MALVNIMQTCLSRPHICSLSRSIYHSWEIGIKNFGKRVPHSFFGAAFRMYYYETVITIYISGDNSRALVRRFLPYSSSTNERRLIGIFSWLL